MVVAWPVVGEAVVGWAVVIGLGVVVVGVVVILVVAVGLRRLAMRSGRRVVVDVVTLVVDRVVAFAPPGFRLTNLLGGLSFRRGAAVVAGRVSFRLVYLESPR